MNGNLHKRILLGFLIGAIAAFSAPQHAVADRSPLVMEGKTSLYQRVLTRPGTPLVENPGEEADANAEPLPPLTPLYVYKRVDLNGRTWFEVGRANQGPTDGWLIGRLSLMISLPQPFSKICKDSEIYKRVHCRISASLS